MAEVEKTALELAVEGEPVVSEKEGDSSDKGAETPPVVETPEKELSPLEAAAREVEDPEDALSREQLSARVQKRIRTLTHQRNDERTAKASLEAVLAQKDKDHIAALEAAKSGRALAETVERHYSSYKDPVAAAEFDVTFMDAFHELAKTNPHVRNIGLQIAEAAKRGGKTVEEPSRKAAEKTVEATPAVTADPRTEKILRKATEAAAGVTLAEFKLEPRFEKQIRERLAGKLEAGDEPTREQAVEACKSFAQQYGYSLAELSGGKAAVKKDTVPVGGAPGGDKPAGGAAPRGERPSTEKAPKDMNEWERGRSERLRALVGSQS